MEGGSGRGVGPGRSGPAWTRTLSAVRLALDTNRYVDLCKGIVETVALLEEAEVIMLPFVVLGELRAGFAHGRRQAENERTLRRFLLTRRGPPALRRRPDDAPLRVNLPPAPETRHTDPDKRHVAGGAGPATQPDPACARPALRSPSASCPRVNWLTVRSLIVVLVSSAACQAESCGARPRPLEFGDLGSADRIDVIGRGSEKVATIGDKAKHPGRCAKRLDCAVAFAEVRQA